MLATRQSSLGTAQSSSSASHAVISIVKRQPRDTLPSNGC